MGGDHGTFLEIEPGWGGCAPPNPPAFWEEGLRPSPQTPHPAFLGGRAAPFPPDLPSCISGENGCALPPRPPHPAIYEGLRPSNSPGFVYMKWFRGGHRLPSIVNNSKMELFGTQPPEPPVGPEVVARRGGSDPPPTRAGGQDDGSLPKLPQRNMAV